MCFGAHVPGGVRNETRGVASFLLLAAGSATTLALLAVCAQRRVTKAVAEHELCRQHDGAMSYRGGGER